MPVFNNILAGAAGQAGGAAAAAGPIKSVRFNRDDTAYLSKTFSSEGNRRKFTYSFWVKRNNVGASEQGVLVEARVTGTPSADSDAFSFRFDTSDRIRVADWGNFYITSTARFRDPSAWYHLVLSVDTTQASNNISVYVNGVLNNQGTYAQNTDTRVNAGSGTVHEIGARTYGSDNYYLDAYLADFYFIDGQALDPTDFGAFDDNGVWQAAAYSGTFGTNGFHLFDFANESGIGNDSSGNDNDFTVNNITSDASTTGVSRVWSSGDTDWSITGSGQYASKSSTSTYADVFSNLLSPGTLYGFTVDIPDGDTNGGWWLGDSNSTSLSGTHPNQGRGTNSIGMRGRSSSPDNNTMGAHGTFATANSVTAGESALSGFSSINPYGATEIDFVVDRINHKCWVKLASDSSWIKGGNPTNPSSTPSFYLPSTGDMYFGFNQYDDQTNLEITQFSVTQTPGADQDVLHDVPTNGDSSNDTGAGGEVSGNYATLNPLSAIGGATISNGNLEGRIDAAATEALYGTIAMSSGKWYWEFTNTSVGAMHGIADLSYADNNWYDGTGGYCYYSGTGNKYQNSNVNSSYGDSYGNGDVIGVAFDADNGDLYFYKNGVAQNSGTAAFTGLSGTFAPFFQDGLGGGNVHTFTVNFGARSFAYSAPSGYKALCTTNLPTPTIADGSDYFDVDLYVGTGSSHERSEFSFSPDFVWIKNRTVARDHRLFDSVRGATKSLQSSNTAAELTESTSLTSFDSDGFTVGSLTAVNESTKNHVAWAWDAGSSTASNTDGSQTSQVRANQTAGFSIATFNTPSSSANFTYGHGLNAAPEFVIHKFRDVSSNWYTYHTSIGQKYINLNDTGAAATNEFTTAPTSSVFTYPSSLIVGNSEPVVAYSFTSVAGYSAFGSYTGASQPNFIYTGFRPSLVICKRTDASGEGWLMTTAATQGYNVFGLFLGAHSSAAEGTSSHYMDLVSNGFVHRHDVGWNNTTGGSYIFMAWAENPFSSNGGIAF